MRIGLLGNPDSVGISDTGNISDRTSKVGIVKLKNISSNVLGLIGDKDNYKIRTRRSGISYQEDNATKQAYADDLANIESSNYIYYLSDSTSDATYGEQQGFDMSWNGRKIFVSFGVFDSDITEGQDQLADKSLTRTADISSSGNYKECSDYTTARPGDSGTWSTNTQNLFWQVEDPFNTKSYEPQVKSIAWSRDGMHLLGGGWTKKRWQSGLTTYNQYATTLWAWRQKTVQGSTSPWGMSYIGGHPDNQDHSVVSYGEEPHWCSDNLLCSWTNLPTGLVPPTLIREWAQDVSWNDDGTKLFYLEYVYDGNNDITASIVRECAPTLRDEDGGNQTLDPNPYILGGDVSGGYQQNLAGTRATFSGSTYDSNDSCSDERWGGIDPPQFGPSSPAVNVGYPYYSNSWNYIGVQWSEVIYSFCFSRDGKKLYVLYVENGDHKVVCHKLSNAWDLLNCPAGYFTLNLGALSDIASYDRKKIRIWKNADILWLFASKNGSNVLKHYQFQQKLY